MRRFLINGFNRFSTWLARNRRVRPGPSPVQVNVGSGLSVAPGWINLDASLNAFFASFPIPFLKLLYRLSDSKKYYSLNEYLDTLKHNRFLHHHITYGLPFPDESVDFIYSSHMLEHLEREEAVHFIEEACRALRPRGILRICVPDLAYAIRLYQEGDKHRSLEYFFVPEHDRALGSHHYLYDEELLSELLERAGFRSVTRCSHGEGRTPDLSVLDNRPEETLYVEGVKES